jgi:hypothetical protein
MSSGYDLASNQASPSSEHEQEKKRASKASVVSPQPLTPRSRDSQFHHPLLGQNKNKQAAKRGATRRDSAASVG